jgi:hypothetical protein
VILKTVSIFLANSHYKYNCAEDWIDLGAGLRPFHHDGSDGNQ